MMRLALVVLGLALVAGCRCAPTLVDSSASLRVAPDALDFGPTFVGSSSTRELTLHNPGRAPIEVSVAVDGAFEALAGPRVITGGASEVVSVRFLPLAPGRATGAVRVGERTVVLSGEGLAVPECGAPAACQSRRFDVDEARCLERPQPNGTACETRCIAGTCETGTCVGVLRGCDDANACTLDSCDEVQGCSHVVRACPRPTNPCRVARCDADAGCGSEPVPDGTLCGPDDCTAHDVDVCVDGTCTRRTRPDSARCANRWAATSIPGRELHALAWDPSLQQVLLFGGSSSGVAIQTNGATGEPSDETWTWDGARWVERLPVTAPSARLGHAMAIDRMRERVVLFGGLAPPTPPSIASVRTLSDTWEWDGSTWLALPVPGPSPRMGHAMCEGPAGTVLLFGGASGPALGDLSDETWEWNAGRWRRLTPMHTPPGRRFHAMAWDPERRRVVLSGGTGAGLVLSDVWEFDGTDWSRAGEGEARTQHALAWDPVLREVVMRGGRSSTGNPMTTLSWNGGRWLQRDGSGVDLGTLRLVTDERAGRLLQYGGRYGAQFNAGTWAWTGRDWSQLSPEVPVGRCGAVFDRDRRRVVVVCRSGAPDVATTWEWTAGTWSRAWTGSLPSGFLTRSPRGRAQLVANTVFEWTGATWVQVSAAADGGPTSLDAASSPTPAGLLVVERQGAAWQWTEASGWSSVGAARSSDEPSAVAFDEARSSALVVGFSFQRGALWDVWNGTAWAQLPASSGPAARDNQLMAWDRDRGLILLYGGRIGIPVNDTWEWDGARWTERRPVRAPPSVLPAFLVYDEDQRRLLLFDRAVMWQLLL